MQIYVSGSLAYDRIMDFPERFSDYILPDKIHVLNVCFTVNSMQEQFGGTAGNIGYNLALLGERPLILATAGRDFKNYADWLKGHGLSLDGIRRVSEEFTAGAYITTDKADNQITGFNPGAMKYQCDYSVDGSNPESSLAIIAPGNPDDMLTYSRTYKERRIPYIFDPGQQIPILPPERVLEMLTGSAVLISNDYELEMIMRVTGLSRSEILERTGAIITTLGEKGSRLHVDGQEAQVPAAKVSQVLDPTGAGDAYRAGLIKGIVMGKSLADSAYLGAVCACYAVECQGTQCHSFTWDEFQTRYESNFGPIT